MSLRDRFLPFAGLFSGLVFLLLLAESAIAQMPRVELAAGIHRIDAEVANTDPLRQQGLMHRRAMAPQEGMLFVFEASQRFCMWMKNTYIPLSVAFLDETGTIVNIEDMIPEDETSHCASRPARYALEMNRGWFQKKGIRPGMKVSGIERGVPAR